MIYKGAIKLGEGPRPEWEASKNQIRIWLRMARNKSRIVLSDYCQGIASWITQSQFTDNCQGFLV